MEQSNNAELSNLNTVDSQSNIIDSTQSSSEKMLTQSHVNNMIKGIKHKYDNRIQEQENKIMQYESELSSRGNQTVSPSNLNEDAIKRIVEQQINILHEKSKEVISHQNAQQQAEKIAYEFKEKMKEGLSKYSDFDEVVSEIPFSSIPGIITLATEMDNTSDIMYELSQNPMRIANLQQLIALNPQNPVQAKKELKKLSDSLYKNDEAKQVKTAKEPLSQSKPSPRGNNNDLSSMSVSDFRKRFGSK